MMDKTHIAPEKFRPLGLKRTRLEPRDGFLLGSFKAMGTPCEVLFETSDGVLAQKLLDIATGEAWRVERKFSRYEEDNIVHRINFSDGEPVEVDPETARLLDYAGNCFHMSDGLFDITSGILRRAWAFDGTDRESPLVDVAALLPLVGWQKVIREQNTISLRPGMEIDLGGIGKEYAVDRTKILLAQESNIGMLVNFGGDIATVNRRSDHQPWRIGIEHVDQENTSILTVPLFEGAITTSGDSKKFVMIKGKRHGHILNPRTGWPAENAPRSVSVLASTCSEAGFLSTLGMLKGKEAGAFLQQANVRHWIN